jgi:hypothetical protein
MGKRVDYEKAVAWIQANVDPTRKDNWQNGSLNDLRRERATTSTSHQLPRQVRDMTWRTSQWKGARAVARPAGCEHEKPSCGWCTEEGLALRPISLPKSGRIPFRETTLPG